MEPIRGPIGKNANETETPDDMLADAFDFQQEIDDDLEGGSQQVTSHTPLVIPPVEVEDECNLTFGCGSHSLVGTRERNEDCAFYTWDGPSFVLSDGIGGAPEGDIMSRAACGSTLMAFDEGKSCKEAFLYGAESTFKTSEWLHLPNSGATLICGRMAGSTLELAWAGDSMALQFRGDELLKATTPDRQSPTSNALGSAVGYSAFVNPITAAWDIEPGDTIVFCSDGVWEAFEGAKGQLEVVVCTDDEAALIAQRLCRMAVTRNKNNKGHSDNSTCIVVKVSQQAQQRGGWEG